DLLDLTGVEQRAELGASQRAVPALVRLPLVEAFHHDVVLVVEPARIELPEPALARTNSLAVASRHGTPLPVCRHLDQLCRRTLVAADGGRPICRNQRACDRIAAVSD